jgi:hypothetical protein
MKIAIRNDIDAVSGGFAFGPRPAMGWMCAMLVGVVSSSVCSLSGCAGGYSAKEKLELALFQFNSGVRWARHRQAGSYLSAKLRKAYLDRVEEMDEQVKVSEVEPLRVDFAKKGTVALVRYRYRWHVKSRMLLRKAIIVEQWVWKDDKWRLMRLWQASGDPFPYFEEMVDKPQPKKETEGKGKGDGKGNETVKPTEKKPEKQ